MDFIPTRDTLSTPKGQIVPWPGWQGKKRKSSTGKADGILGRDSKHRLPDSLLPVCWSFRNPIEGTALHGQVCDAVVLPKYWLLEGTCQIICGKQRPTDPVAWITDDSIPQWPFTPIEHEQLLRFLAREIAEVSAVRTETWAIRPDAIIQTPLITINDHDGMSCKATILGATLHRLLSDIRDTSAVRTEKELGPRPDAPVPEPRVFALGLPVDEYVPHGLLSGRIGDASAIGAETNATDIVVFS